MACFWDFCWPQSVGCLKKSRRKKNEENAAIITDNDVEYGKRCIFLLFLEQNVSLHNVSTDDIFVDNFIALLENSCVNDLV